MAQQALPPAPSAAEPSSACSTRTAGAGRRQGDVLVPDHHLPAGLHPEPRLLLHGVGHRRGGLQRASRPSTGAQRPTRTCPARRRPAPSCPGSPAPTCWPCPAPDGRRRGPVRLASLPRRRHAPDGPTADAADDRGRQDGNFQPGRRDRRCRSRATDAAIASHRRAVRHRRPRRVGRAHRHRVHGHLDNGELTGWALADGTNSTPDLTLPTPLSGAAAVATTRRPVPGRRNDRGRARPATVLTSQLKTGGVDRVAGDRGAAAAGGARRRHRHRSGQHLYVARRRRASPAPRRPSTA